MSQSTGLPLLRGTLHATTACLIPSIAASLAIVWPARATDIAVVAAVCWVQSVLSARLHLCHDRISRRDLVWTQTLDHCAVALCITCIAWSFGAWMPPMYAGLVVHLVVKLTGPPEHTRLNAWTVGAMFVMCSLLVVARPLTTDQKIRYAVVFANSVAAQLAFVLQWPLLGHPVWGYHEITHIATVVVLAMMWWNVIAP